VGADFNCRSFEGDDRKAIQKQWIDDVEQDLYDHGHSYSGGIGMLGTDIQWERDKFETARDASKHIEDFHKKWEPPMACQFEGGWVVGGWCSS
jgi:hypothetical protein